MPRTESRTKTAIWSNEDFLSLGAQAQRLYWLMFSQPNIALTGVLPITVNRWAKFASDTTPEIIMSALSELEDKNFVVCDYATEEIYITAFILHDGVLNSPKVKSAALSQVSLILSKEIRALVLQILNDEKDTKVQENTLSDTVSDNLSDRVSDTHRRLEVGGINLKEEKNQFENEFLELWKVMAKNPTSSKKIAMNAYCARRKEGVDFETLERAVINYKDYVTKNHTEPKYIMQAQTFFGSNERYLQFADMIVKRPPAIDHTQGFTVIKNFDTSSL